MNSSPWYAAHTQVILVTGTAAGITTDLTPPASTVYRVLFCQAFHSAAAARNLRWAIIATAALTIGPADNIAVGGIKYLYTLPFEAPIILHNGETLRINSDVVGAEHCDLTAVVEVVRGAPN